MAIPRTLLVDSEQLSNSDALPPDFRTAARNPIDAFRRERAQRFGFADAEASISDEDMMREMLNTVGRSGRLGGSVRCVVSVAMLTEGWDANTVTHILGVRAFGTQLLCEQVVGRALRRQSYELNEETNLLEAEYADVLGVPFDFTDSDSRPKPRQQPAVAIRVFAVSPERDHLEIQFPIVSAYRIELPNDRIEARFDETSILRLTPALVGPTRTWSSCIVGEGISLTAERLSDARFQEVKYKLAAHVLQTQLVEPGEALKTHLFPQLCDIVGHWLQEYLFCDQDTFLAQITYPQVLDMASQRIKDAIVKAVNEQQPESGRPVKAVVNDFSPLGSTKKVDFTISKKPRGPSDQFIREIFETDPDKCHVNFAVCDSSWETSFCRIVEAHPNVIAYVKNRGLGLDVPYRLGTESKTYIPDFVVQIDDGNTGEDPRNLVAEVEGFRGEDAYAKTRTMKSYWVPGVNNLGSYGRWHFHEFTSIDNMSGEFARVVETCLRRR